MSANVRQRVFDAMAKPAQPSRTAFGWALQCLGVSGESCRTVLKHFVAIGLATRERRGREFVYRLVEGAKRPIDGRANNGRRRKANAAAQPQP